MTSPATPALDLFTVKAMTLVTVLVVSFATFFASSLNRRVAGIRQFARGLLLLAFGAVLGIARVVVPGNAIFVLCNAFMVGGMMTAVNGIRAFRGMKRYSRATVGVASGVITLFYCYWLFAHDEIGMRVGVISAAFALLSVDAAVSMFRRVSRHDRLVYWPTSFAFGFAAFYMTVRAVSAFSGRYGTSIFAPVPVEIACTICANIAYVGCAFGMLVASNTRLRVEAEKKALIDPLTNLPNRRLFWDRLMEAEERALATNRKFGLIYFDLDDFKMVNDQLGHDVGDDLLRRVSRSMARTLRLVDCLGRIGGDEFVVLVEDVSTHDHVETLARRLKSAVEREPVASGSLGPTRISYGIALFPDDGRHAHDALRQADAAMYVAKQRGHETTLQEISTPDFVVRADLRQLDENLTTPIEPAAESPENVPKRRKTDRILPQSSRTSEERSKVSWASRFRG